MPITKPKPGSPIAFLSRLQRALDRWADILGPQHVLDDPDTIATYGRTTLVEAHRPLAVVRPGSTAEVQQVVELAAREVVPLYPISKGKNWGYGDACPSGPDHVILDLGRMNRIVEVDDELGYAVVEPGVTQAQLYECLSTRQSPFIADCTGAGPDASVIGNTLERGFGHTPYGDHALNSCGMEVVLPDGRLLRTGFGHFEACQAKHLYKWGLGPYLDGLFCQSSLGVVNQLGVWLLPRPESVDVFSISLDRDDKLESLIQALGPLRRDGTLRSLVHLGNDLRIISAQQPYPWDEAGGVTPLPPEIRSGLRRRHRLGAWTAVGALYGSRAQVAADRRRLTRALRGVARVTYIGARKAAIARAVLGLAGRFGLAARLRQTLASFDELYGLLHGKPTTSFFQGTLWRTRGTSTDHGPHDPLDHDAGLIWLGPVLPMTGRAARDVMQLVTPIFERHRFDPCVTLSLVTERAMVAVMNISFDRSDPEEAKRARDCYKQLLQRLFAAGYPPYRLGSTSYEQIPAEDDIFWNLVARLKVAIDPQHIFARGRYLPSSAYNGVGTASVGRSKPTLAN